MPDWAVQLLRVSLFSSGAVALTEARHWKLLTGQDEAENRLTIPGGKQYVGKFLSSVFNLAFYAQRCDVIANADDTMPDTTKLHTLPTFGLWDEVLDEFLAAVCPFVEAFEFPIIRVAFGGVLLAAAESKEDSYRQLGELVQSVKIDPVRMRELVYRVNWPQQSSVVNGLELNRLTTWNSIMFARGLMQITGAEVTMATAESSLNAARLEFDMNTFQGRKEPFEAGTVVPILHELVFMARENAKAGERP